MQNVHIVRQGFVRSAVALNAFVALLQAGCNSSDSTDSKVLPPTASLELSITSPAVVTPSVTVSGPSGYRQTLTVSQTLRGLALGEYTVAAEPVFVPHPMVGTVYDATMTVGTAVSPETAVVTLNTTATVNVSYAARPGTGSLWVGSAAGGIGSSAFLAYSATQLQSNTSAEPSITLVPHDNAVPAAAALDAGGTLWAAMNYDNSVANTGTVVGFGQNQLQLAARLPYPVTPLVTLTVTGGAREFLRGMAVDGDGSVWVTKYTASTIDLFWPSQLAATGSPAPAITLSATSGSLSGPAALAFDGNVNLWVANATSNTVVQFTSMQTQASGSPTPAVTVSANSGSLDRPAALAFDAAGNLWVANANSSTVVEFTGSQLATSGTPTPAVKLSANNGSLSGPSSLAFDASGDLWVANQVGNTIVEFAADQLGASGAPTPIVTVSGSALSSPRGLVFNPSPLSCAGCWDYGLSVSVAEKHPHLARSVRNPNGVPTPASPRR